MNRPERPEFFTLRDGNQTHIVLAWSAEAARALGIPDRVRSNGRVLTTWRLDGPQPPRPMGKEIASGG